MAIWIEKQLVSTSTLAVACLSSLAAGTIKQERQPERELTCDVLDELGKRMEAAGIEKFDDNFYHGLIHPYDGYDLVASIPQGAVFVQKKKKIAVPAVSFPQDGFLTLGCFRLMRTTGVGQMLLLGKSSRVLDLVPAWLLAEKDMPQSRSPLLVT